MKPKIVALREEERELVKRLGELQAEQTTVRAAMLADPLQAAQPLSNKFAQIQIQAEVFNEKLGMVKKDIQAEDARLNSSEVKAGVKRAEKIVDEGKELAKSINKDLADIQDKINVMLEKNAEAARLLQDGGRENVAVFGTHSAFMQYTKNTLQVWRRDMGNEMKEYR